MLTNGLASVNVPLFRGLKLHCCYPSLCDHMHMTVVLLRGIVFNYIIILDILYIFQVEIKGGELHYLDTCFCFVS